MAADGEPRVETAITRRKEADPPMKLAPVSLGGQFADRHLSLVRLEDPGHQTQQSRLARSVLATDVDERSRIHDEGDVPKDHAPLRPSAKVPCHFSSRIAASG